MKKTFFYKIPIRSGNLCNAFSYFKNKLFLSKLFVATKLCSILFTQNCSEKKLK